MITLPPNFIYSRTGGKFYTMYSDQVTRLFSMSVVLHAKLEMYYNYYYCEDCVKEENSCCWAPFVLSNQSEEIIH